MTDDRTSDRRVGPPYDDIPGTYVFDARRSRLGYRLNEFLMSLNVAENRDAFRADEGAYLHLKVSSVATANASWTKPIDVFFRLQQGQWRLVGLERTAS